jgi:hypothetical protein
MRPGLAALGGNSVKLIEDDSECTVRRLIDRLRLRARAKLDPIKADAHVGRLQQHALMLGVENVGLSGPRSVLGGYTIPQECGLQLYVAAGKYASSPVGRRANGTTINAKALNLSVSFNG